MKVKLAEGRLLRDPVSKLLMKPDEVREVPDTSMYWRRRLKAGDVVSADAPAPHRRPAAHAPAKE
jgi:hypothetical protein